MHTIQIKLCSRVRTEGGVGLNNLKTKEETPRGKVFQTPELTSLSLKMRVTMTPRTTILK